jgi:hypothetical protein
MGTRGAQWRKRCCSQCPSKSHHVESSQVTSWRSMLMVRFMSMLQKSQSKAVRLTASPKPAPGGHVYDVPSSGWPVHRGSLNLALLRWYLLRRRASVRVSPFECAGGVQGSGGGGGGEAPLADTPKGERSSAAFGSRLIEELEPHVAAPREGEGGHARRRSAQRSTSRARRKGGGAAAVDARLGGVTGWTCISCRSSTRG